MIYKFRKPEKNMEFTGERFVSSQSGGIQHTHHHRYLAAVPFCTGKHVLDVACGEGYGTSLLGEFTNSIIGIDYDKDAIAFATECYGRDGVDFLEGTAEDLPFPDNAFDIVTSFETIEHLNDAEKFLNEIARVLKPDGIAIISSPNRDIYSTKDRHKNPYHTREFTVDEFKNLLISHFKFVDLYAQERIFGSIILPISNESYISAFETSDGQEYEVNNIHENPRYIVATASNSNLDIKLDSVLTNATYANELKQHLEYYKRNYSELQTRHTTATNLNAKLKQNLDQAQGEAEAAKLAHSVLENSVKTNVEILHAAQLKQIESIAETLHIALKNDNNTPTNNENQPTNEFTQDVLFPIFYKLRYIKLRMKAILWWALLRRDPFQYATTVARGSTDRYAAFIRYQENKRAVRSLLISGRLKHPFSRPRRQQWHRDQLSKLQELSTPMTPAEAQAVDVSAPVNAELFSQWVANAVKPELHHEHQKFGGVEISNPSPAEARLIAYYLPQFHPIPENDKWWGEGFTEWRNVARAFPIFEGHYQPRIPGELGYYDLRVPDVMRRQVELARHYGISAFCFHFYWFAGKTLLELPIERFYEDKSLELNYFLSWANENWSRRWDGSENEVLIAQEHSIEDARQFLEHIRKYMEDERYLRIDGKPVLSIYRPAIIPNLGEMIAEWRRLATSWGFPGLYLIATNAFGFTEYHQFGFDALSEFPPHCVAAQDIQPELKVSDVRKSGRVRPYDEIVENMLKRPISDGTVHPGIIMGWDNSARKPDWGDIIHGATPSLFKKWLDDCIKRASRHRTGERLVFVNAWNEWAEGTYLEPDARFGYAYLEACAASIWTQRYGAVERPRALKGRRAGIDGQPRILVCGHHAGLVNFGGERSFLDVLRALGTAGLTLIVTLPDVPGDTYQDQILELCSELQILPYRRWHEGERTAFDGVADLVATIRECRIDLVYANTSMVRGPIEAARYCNVPSIIHLRELMLHDDALQADVGLGGEEVTDIIVRSADLVIANSKATLSSLSSTKNASVVPNVIDLEKFTNIPRREGSDVVIGIISSNIPKKGINDFIAIARHFENTHEDVIFEIIGPCNGDAVSEYHSSPETLPKNVKLVGYLDEPAEIYGRLDVVMNLSHFQESFGRTVLEGMAAGRPIIAYEWGAIPELVVNGETGLLVPFKDIPQACAAVIQMLDRDFRHHCGQLAAAHAVKLSNFSSYSSGIRRAVVDCRNGFQERQNAPSTLPPDVTIDIVVCVHNALIDVMICLESVIALREMDERLILVDDGSGTETREYLEKLAEQYAFIDLHRNDVALGYTGAANMGASASSADVIVFLNSDTIVTKGWVRKLAASLYSDTGTAIVGPLSNAASFQSIPDVVGQGGQTPVNVLPPNMTPEDVNRTLEEMDDGTPIKVPLVHGFCFAVQRSAWEDIGTFDVDAFPRGYGEENDYCFRAVNKGYTLQIAANTYVHHSKSKSYSAEKRLPLVEQAQRILHDRYGEKRFAEAITILGKQPQLVHIRKRIASMFNERA